GHLLAVAPPVATALADGRSGDANALLRQLLGADEDIVYVQVVDAGGRPVAWAATPGTVDIEDAVQRTELMALHERGSIHARLLRLSVPLAAASAGMASTQGPRVLLGMSPRPQGERLRGLLAAGYALAALSALLITWFFFTRLFARLARLQA